jgi:addiction module HigA family antidote
MSLIPDPSHPGEVLSELYLKPLGLSAIALAKRLDVPRTRIERLIKQETTLSADSAIRLAAFFDTTAEYWLNLQGAWDLAQARKAVDVSRIIPLEAA